MCVCMGTRDVKTGEREGRKEIFYLRIYGVGHLLKDYSDSERGNPLPPHGLLFPISSKGSFICIIPHRITHHPTIYMHHPTDRIAHYMSVVIQVVEHWLEREIAQWVHNEGSIRRPIAPLGNALATELHLAPGGREGWEERENQ